MDEGKPIDVTDVDFDSEVLRSQLPVLVDFWAPWCGPCRMAGPVLDKIAKEYGGKVKVCKVNVDDHRQVAIDNGIMSIPTLNLYKDGQLVDQMTGVTPSFEADIKKKIEPHLDQT
jgi:thioredoxin 1